MKSQHRITMLNSNRAHLVRYYRYIESIMLCKVVVMKNKKPRLVLVRAGWIQVLFTPSNYLPTRSIPSSGQR